LLQVPILNAVRGIDLKFFGPLLVLIAVLAAAGGHWRSDASATAVVAAAPPIATGPVAYVGHGALFALDGTELAPTATFVSRTQSFYRSQLLSRAGAKQATRLAAMHKKMTSGLRLDKRQRLVVDVLLLDWLIRRVNPPDAERLLGINHHLKRAVRSGNISKALRARILRAGLLPRRRTPTSRALVTPATGQAYIGLCRQNGVPIPPDWGTAQWVKQGNLTSVFISNNLQAEVYTSKSTSPEGMSVALPRYDGDRIELLGIISIGKQSGNVCFWDNQTGNPLSPQFFPQRGQVVPIDMFGGGASLLPNVGGRCSSCHAGENPYIVHPATVLGQLKTSGLPTFADRYYEPFIPAGFPENPVPTPITAGPASAGSCSGCHFAGGPGGRFPELSADVAEYCGILSRAFAGGTTSLGMPIAPTMPPSNPGSQSNEPQPVALLQQCRYFVSQTPPPTTVQSSSSFTATVTFMNPDRMINWIGSHTLAFAPPPNGPQVWQAPASFNGALGTPGQPIGPGSTVTRTVTVLTPSQPGTYEFAFVVRDPGGRIIGRSPATKITVMGTGPIPNASIVINTAPNSLGDGQSTTVTATATNNGQTTWTATDHIVRLGRILRISLPQNTVAIPSGGVGPGQSFTFNFTILCNGSGQGGFTVQMASSAAGPFGQSVGRTVVCQP